MECAYCEESFDGDGDVCVECAPLLEAEGLELLDRLSSEIESKLETVSRRKFWRGKSVNERRTFAAGCIEHGYVTIEISNNKDAPMPTASPNRTVCQCGALRASRDLDKCRRCGAAVCVKCAAHGSYSSIYATALCVTCKSNQT